MYTAAVAAAAAIDADKRALGFVGYRRPGNPEFPFSNIRPAGEHRTLAQGGVVSVSTGMSTSRAGVPVMNQCLSRWRTSCCCTRAADQRHTARAGRPRTPLPFPTPESPPQPRRYHRKFCPGRHTHTHTHTHTYTHMHTHTHTHTHMHTTLRRQSGPLPRRAAVTAGWLAGWLCCAAGGVL